MDKKVSKKWKTDYSQLLKCWAEIKTSNVMKESAEMEIKRLCAEDKALNLLEDFLHKIKSEETTRFGQAMSLWQKVILLLKSQHNFALAAECLQSLADLEFKYGSTEHKRESLSTLLESHDCYIEANDTKRALIAMKMFLTINELSPKNNIKDLVDGYHTCSRLYESLGLRHLAKINKNISEELEDNSNMTCRVSTSSSSLANDCSDGESSLWDNNSLEEEVIDSKEAVHQEIEERMQTSTCAEVSSVQESDPDDRGLEKSESQEKQNSNQTSSLISSDETVVEEMSSSKKMKINDITDEQMTDDLTTQVLPVPIVDKRKPKKRKLKEISEESPERRLNKLLLLGQKHYFCVDPQQPETRLRCSLCKESIFCYRWSIVTDHLKGKKHIQFVHNEEERKLIEDLKKSDENIGFTDNMQTFVNCPFDNTYTLVVSHIPQSSPMPFTSMPSTSMTAPLVASNDEMIPNLVTTNVDFTSCHYSSEEVINSVINSKIKITNLKDVIKECSIDELLEPMKETLDTKI